MSVNVPGSLTSLPMQGLNQQTLQDAHQSARQAVSEAQAKMADKSSQMSRNASGTIDSTTVNLRSEQSGNQSVISAYASSTGKAIQSSLLAGNAGDGSVIRSALNSGALSGNVNTTALGQNSAALGQSGTQNSAQNSAALGQSGMQNNAQNSAPLGQSGLNNNAALAHMIKSFSQSTTLNPVPNATGTNSLFVDMTEQSAKGQLIPAQTSHTEQSLAQQLPMRQGITQQISTQQALAPQTSTHQLSSQQAHTQTVPTQLGSTDAQIQPQEAVPLTKQGIRANLLQNEIQNLTAHLNTALVEGKNSAQSGAKYAAETTNHLGTHVNQNQGLNTGIGNIAQNTNDVQLSKPSLTNGPHTDPMVTAQIAAGSGWMAHLGSIINFSRRWGRITLSNMCILTGNLLALLLLARVAVQGVKTEEIVYLVMGILVAIGLMSAPLWPSADKNKTGHEKLQE